MWLLNSDDDDDDEVPELCKQQNVVLTLNCPENVVKLIFEIIPNFFIVFTHQLISLHSYLKIDLCTSK